MLYVMSTIKQYGSLFILAELWQNVFKMLFIKNGFCKEGFSVVFEIKRRMNNNLTF